MYTKKPKTIFVDIATSQPIKQNGLLGEEHKKHQKEKNVYSKEYENPTVWWSI